MLQKKIKITSTNGLHTRPAARFVKLAQEFLSDITVTSCEQTVNGKSLFKLQTLDLSQNTIITISANGKDEKKAVEELINMIKQLS
ncbi:HPr family phosphocarrier protein [Buchnera aphidicola]|uniref:HPr family phosphocarrier protein n=1 Tax=Buchnera aphidicola TaxID=9 RepID=UPI0031B85311